DTQMVEWDVLMSEQNFDSMAIEGAVLAQGGSVGDLPGETDVLVEQQHKNVETLTSQLARYTGWVMSISQIRKGRKVLQGSEYLTARWGKCLKTKKVSLVPPHKISVFRKI